MGRTGFEFTYDGDGHRTQIKEYTAGTLTTTRDFIYQGDAIVQEKTNATISREYIDDENGTVIKFCDPNCGSPTTTYLVTWNGHGDAIGAWRINADGTLTLANSYTYTSWGSPTTTPASGFSDLGLRFLYVGQGDVQWDNFSGLGLYYMHARHYSPALGRFLQPDPARLDLNAYGYAADSPVSKTDAAGLEGQNQWERGLCASRPNECRSWWWASTWAVIISMHDFRGDQYNGDIFSWLPDHINPRRDAMRHCVWQCLLTERLGSTEAWIWGYLHELRESPAKDPVRAYISSAVDFHNNEVGRSLGREIQRDFWKPIWDVSGTVPFVAESKCLNAMHTGRLWLFLPPRGVARSF